MKVNQKGNSRYIGASECIYSLVFPPKVFKVHAQLLIYIFMHVCIYKHIHILNVLLMKKGFTKIKNLECFVILNEILTIQTICVFLHHTHTS